MVVFLPGFFIDILFKITELTIMKSRIFITFVITLTLTLASNWSFAKDELPEVTIEGLHLVKNTKLSVVYAVPGADLSQYKRIYLVDAYVAFRKNWQRDHNRTSANRISSNDMERIKAAMVDLFREVFTETLEEGGYELATERAEDVLIIKPAIINLDATAPDTMSVGRSRTYSVSSGSMSLYIELYDSVTDAIIAKALDNQSDRNFGVIQWQSRVTNKAAARRILKAWAEILKNALDESRNS